MEKKTVKHYGNKAFPKNIMARKAQVQNRWNRLDALMVERPQSLSHIMLFNLKCMWTLVKGKMQRRHEQEDIQFVKSEARFLRYLEDRSRSLPHVSKADGKRKEKRTKVVKGKEEIDTEDKVPQEIAVATVGGQLLDKDLEGAEFGADSTTTTTTTTTSTTEACSGMLNE